MLKCHRGLRQSNECLQQTTRHLNRTVNEVRRRPRGLRLNLKRRTIQRVSRSVKQRFAVSPEDSWFSVQFGGCFASIFIRSASGGCFRTAKYVKSRSRTRFTASRRVPQWRDMIVQRVCATGSERDAESPDRALCTICPHPPMCGRERLNNESELAMLPCCRVSPKFAALRFG